MDSIVVVINRRRRSLGYQIEFIRQNYYMFYWEPRWTYHRAMRLRLAIYRHLRFNNNTLHCLSSVNITHSTTIIPYTFDQDTVIISRQMLRRQTHIIVCTRGLLTRIVWRYYIIAMASVLDPSRHKVMAFGLY